MKTRSILSPWRLCAVFGLIALAAGSVRAGPGALFVPLVGLDRAEPSSSANALSANGLVVTGGAWKSSVGASVAYRWTQAGGMVQIAAGAPDSLSPAWGTGVSAGGSVVSGWANGAMAGFRWTEVSGPVSLSPAQESSGKWAHAVSANASVIVGQMASGSSGWVATKWTGSGAPLSLGWFAGGAPASVALGVSGDGSVIVGWAALASPFSGPRHAFRHAAAGGMVDLGDLAGGESMSYARGVSADGALVTGYGTTAVGRQAFVWSAKSGMVPLPHPRGTTRSDGLAIASDGTMVVGWLHSSAQADPDLHEAMVWDPDHGMRRVAAVFTDQYGLGAALAGWTLTRAVGVAVSGGYVTFAGNGINPDGLHQAWWARVPDPFE